MPSGTTVGIEVADLTEANLLDCAIDKVIGTTVGNVTAVTNHQANFKGCAAGDRVSVKVTTPSGQETTITFPFP